MTITTTTTISNPVNVDYQIELLKRAEAVCPYFAGSTPASISYGAGTFTAKWRRYEKFDPVTTPLAELTGSLGFPTRTPSAPTITDITATVAKYGNFCFLNEEVELVQPNRVAMELSGALGENAGQSLNRLQRNEMEDNSTQIFGGSATTATNVSGLAGVGFLTRTKISGGVNALQRNNARKFMPMTRGSTNIGTAPVRESFIGICHPDTEEDIRTLTGFSAVETYAGQTETMIGEIGHVGGVRWISTSEGTIDAGSGLSATASATSDGRSTSGRYDNYISVIYGRDAVGSLGFGSSHVKEVYREGDNLPAVMMISHPRGSAGTADPLNEVSSIGWKSWHVPKILNSSWIRAIVHASSRLS